ncbi:hypothetical protein COHA_006821 [Chlorella ohadii]|uniref:Uncharacterized protein n=1 Tax=Chlorella ohadii TaxID=2649997 RepID=A0AAD5H411_9CHLO|nr:hypothetical protein COHA_006821 [Chlorella ohadii]
MPSTLFDSEMFNKEMMELTQQLVSIQQMISKFADFDLEGKKIFIDQMEQLGEKLQIIMMRMQLADDPAGNEFLRMQRVQMLEAGTSMAATMDGFKAELEEMRKMVQLEETCADPTTLDAVKRAYRQKFEYASKFNPMEVFSDPELMDAAMDPEAMKAMSEVVENPSRIENWRHKPQLYALLKKMLGQA